MSLYRINGTNGFIQLEDGVITVHRDDSGPTGLNTYRLDITKDTYPLGRLPRSENPFLSVMDKSPRKGEYLHHKPENDPLSIMIPKTLADDEIISFMKAVWEVSEKLRKDDPKFIANQTASKNRAAASVKAAGKKPQNSSNSHELTFARVIPPVPAFAPKASPAPLTRAEKHALRHVESVEALELPVVFHEETPVEATKEPVIAEVAVIPEVETEVVSEALPEPEIPEVTEPVIAPVASEPVVAPAVSEPVIIKEETKSYDEHAIDFVEKVKTSTLPVIQKLPPLPRREIMPVPEFAGHQEKMYGRQWFIDCTSPYVREYVVVDIETTGLDEIDDRIIEIAAIRYIDDVEISRFSSFVRPYTPQLMAEYTFAEFEELAGTTGINYIEDPYITTLTGIDNHMLVDAPSADQIAPVFFDFIGNLPVVGHNFLEFDLKFLRNMASETKTRTSIGHDIIDTMKMAEVFAKDAGSRALTNVGLFLGAPETVSHRALEDAVYTAYIYREMKKLATPAEAEQFRIFNNDHLSHLTIVPNPDSIIASDAFYGKNVVFTGSMKMYRGQAMQYVIDGGGKLTQGITKQTDYLVAADDNDTNDGLKLRKSFQHRQAGQSITLIQEKDFYTLIGRENYVEWKKSFEFIEDPSLEPAIPL